MKKVVLLIFLLTPYPSAATDKSPYVGEERRTVRSLSDAEIKSLSRGDGMGFAKLAELNHYPGPRHVLDLSDELGLSEAQITETQLLYEEMRLNAVGLGNKIIAKESRLDQEFRRKSLTSQTLETALLEIGNLRARLRYVHLEAHLRQGQLLSNEQIMKYDALRGYQGERHDHKQHSSMHE